jgi:hypothetical protein
MNRGSALAEEGSMRPWLIALLLCGCSSNTVPVQNDGAPQGDMTMQSGGDMRNQSGGDLSSSSDMSMSSNADLTMSSGGDLSFVCGKPGMTGNEKGVGTYCTAGGNQCMMGTLCPADFGVAESFCTLLCSGPTDTTTCGTNAQCQCQGAQCGCIPSCCLNGTC